jgi:hypothetical protein
MTNNNLAGLDAMSEQATEESSFIGDTVNICQSSTSQSISESEMDVMWEAAKMAVKRVKASRAARLSGITY